MKKKKLFEEKKKAHLIRAEIGEDKNRKIIITLILPDYLQEEFLMREGECNGNFKPIVKRIEVMTEQV